MAFAFLLLSGAFAAAQNSPVTNPPPSITLILPTNGTVFTAGANVRITVNVGNPDGTVARVEFLTNGQVMSWYPRPA